MPPRALASLPQRDTEEVPRGCSVQQLDGLLTSVPGCRSAAWSRDGPVLSLLVQQDMQAWTDVEELWVRYSETGSEGGEATQEATGEGAVCAAPGGHWETHLQAAWGREGCCGPAEPLQIGPATCKPSSISTSPKSLACGCWGDRKWLERQMALQGVTTHLKGKNAPLVRGPEWAWGTFPGQQLSYRDVHVTWAHPRGGHLGLSS